MDNLLLTRGQLKKEGRVNHSIIEHEEYKNQDLRSIQILNAQINGGCFIDVNISNSDMFSTKLFAVQFQNVDFKYSDINSIWATNCTFVNVDFEGSTLTDSTFKECKFIGCNFSHIGMLSNQFIGCEIKDYYAEHCTITLNEFTNCRLTDFRLCSTFYYQIFDCCTFENVELEDELLGFNYGLLHILQDFDESRIDRLKSSFLNNAQLLNVAVVEINHNEDSLNVAMLACIHTISKMLINDIIIKSDEFAFVTKLFEYFSSKNLIAPICIVECWRVISELERKNIVNSAYSKALGNLNGLKNFLFLRYQTYISRLSSDLVDGSLPSEANEHIELELYYHKKPKLDLVSLLESLILKFRLQIPGPTLLRTADGSFIEWIAAHKDIVPYIQAFITFLGVFIPVVKKNKSENKKNIEQKIIPSEKAEDRETSLQNIQTTDSIINVPVFMPERDGKAEQIASQIIQVTFENNFLGSADYMGYNSKNVINITVNYTI